MAMTDQLPPGLHDQPSKAEMEAKIAERPIHGFRRMMGYKTTVWAERYCEVELTIDARHDNSHGIVHGGVYAALMDAACGGAVAYCNAPGGIRLAVTITLQTTYLASAKRGMLTASARLIAVEGRVATCACEVRLDDGTLCATGHGSFMYLHGSEAPDGIPAAMRKKPV